MLQQSLMRSDRFCIKKERFPELVTVCITTQLTVGRTQTLIINIRVFFINTFFIIFESKHESKKFHVTCFINNKKKIHGRQKIAYLSQEGYNMNQKKLKVTT